MTGVKERSERGLQGDDRALAVEIYCDGDGTTVLQLYGEFDLASVSTFETELARAEAEPGPHIGLRLNPRCSLRVKGGVSSRRMRHPLWTKSASVQVQLGQRSSFLQVPPSPPVPIPPLEVEIATGMSST